MCKAQACIDETFGWLGWVQVPPQYNGDILSALSHIAHEFRLAAVVNGMQRYEVRFGNVGLLVLMRILQDLMIGTDQSQPAVLFYLDEPSTTQRKPKPDVSIELDAVHQILTFRQYVHPQFTPWQTEVWTRFVESLRSDHCLSGDIQKFDVGPDYATLKLTSSGLSQLDELLPKLVAHIKPT